MKKFLILLLCFFMVNSFTFANMRRDYSSISFCKLHPVKSSRAKFSEKYLKYIPEINNQCYHVDCSKCHDAWPYKINEDIDGKVYRGIFWDCECELKGRDHENWLPTWKRCNSSTSIYAGYFDYKKKYFSLFYEYLQYVDSNPICQCYWPELSKRAEEVNNQAYSLFKNLFETTALNNLVSNDNEEQEEFFNLSWDDFINLHGVCVQCVCHSFFFSDYDWICRDLEVYSKSKFSEEEFALILNKLDDIRWDLGIAFLSLYTDCLKHHHSERIEQELFLLKTTLFLPEMYGSREEPIEERIVCACLSTFEQEDFEDYSQKTILKHSQKNSRSMLASGGDRPIAAVRSENWLGSDILLQKGIILNDALLHKEAIEVLTESIKLNSQNREAYIERAAAYFETNQITLALEDYKTIKNLSLNPPFNRNLKQSLSNKYHFSKGLISGTLEGGKLATVEFLPGVFSSCRGLLNGLWAFACSPVDVSYDLANSAYALGAFLSSEPMECLECIVPELKELSKSWDIWDEQTKGHKIGFIIGKYGIDIFIPGATLKGATKLRALKQANTVFTLETCLISEAKQAKILEESAKIAANRAKYIEGASRGKILTKTSNVQYHVMQKKHDWEKVLKLSGNTEEDFKKVVLLLEENSILSKVYLVESSTYNYGKIIRNDYSKIINGHAVYAVFETHVETNLVFLKDAWVVK